MLMNRRSNVVVAGLILASLPVNVYSAPPTPATSTPIAYDGGASNATQGVRVVDRNARTGGDAPQGGLFIDPGADDCIAATVVPVAVGPSGFPNSVTITGDNSTASGGGECVLPATDLGWWEAFEILDYADVVIDLCGTSPNQRPNWAFLSTGCGCAATIGFDFAERSSCGDFNITTGFFGLPPGIYYYPVYTIPGDKRCGDTGATCVSDANCTFPIPCTDNLHPYTMHISAEVALGGCCHANLATCDDFVPNGSCTGPEDRWVPGTPCSNINCVPFNSGPDLIVGNVRNCEQLGREGPAGGGTIGMSCWTTACTIGDQGTDWYGLPDVNHPMISVNLFRLRDEGGADRLVQLGQSWLKHGFGTENANDCGFGCTPGHFNLNGPGCSDTYAAQQFVPCDMGPRSMINPYTGEMPVSVDLGPSSDCVPVLRETESYPANDHRDHDHNNISHRLQVRDTDLIPAMNPGARYFSEGQYLTPHEFVAGNGTQNNNVSHREVFVGCGGVCGVDPYFFVDAGETTSESPAIDAWSGASQALIEPQPLVDGRGYLVYKVTDLGGVWRYEYGLYNMNMDRAMNSLSIPHTPGVTISNIGFYAPLNHAPEPHTVNYDNTAWNVDTGGNAVTWSTDSFGVNPNANAVRFGTLYNFWFDADAPPTTQEATIELFKTGGSVTATTLGPGGEVSPPPNITWSADPSTPSRGTRSLTISASAATASGGSGSSAIRLELVDLQNPNPANAPCCPPPNFGPFESATCNAMDEGNGCVRWLGPTATILESQDNIGLGTFIASRLQCTPYYADWTTLGPIVISGPEIMPSSVYELLAFAASCKGVEGACTNVSSPVQAVTRRSGDLATPWNPPSNSVQPDSLDVVAVVNKFRNQPGAPSKAIAQVQPNKLELNNDVGALDCVAVLDGFRGSAYPFTGPCSCPSTVSCAIPCTTNTQCPTGGSCTRFCVGGDNANLPCISSTHCPNGTCPPTGSPNGFCRDRCGRCQ